MTRLEKSALIIWKKHSYLAISQKEDYEDWLAMYRKDRDMHSAGESVQARFSPGLVEIKKVEIINNKFIWVRDRDRDRDRGLLRSGL